ncbi:ribonuclease M5 [Polycladomyces sp. WAk]|uniref:Ribonuclease M5 n=1 Tax=Polycladomyces zharkentensis TaxID=2807616 RepID=A0ABS2WN25_9BACL|nr:ribonuclease M5 [Polycladomyces sp. WAk]MBN2910680.1 ribonuclease M5 [Polycladomyces sp. WAk]
MGKKVTLVFTGKLKEVIVVEGKNDTAAVRRAVSADTLETGGDAVDETVLAAIEQAQAKRGVIIMTDPDGAGERIRRIISQRVEGCKHAFLTREEATGKDGIGVEHASPEAIRRALSEVRCETESEGNGEVTWIEYLDAGLAGGVRARRLREAMGRHLGIGYANARQFFRRIQMFRITRSEFRQALIQAEKEEQGGTTTHHRSNP